MTAPLTTTQEDQTMTLLTVPASTPRTLLGIAEAVFWTLLQTFVMAMPATLPLTTTDARAVAFAGLAAAIAASVSLAKNLTKAAAGTLASRSVAERVFWTLLAAFVGTLPATMPLTTDNAKAALYSALAAVGTAVLALVKNAAIPPPPPTTFELELDGNKVVR